MFFNKSNKIQSFVQGDGFVYTVPVNGAVPDMLSHMLSGSPHFAQIPTDEFYNAVKKSDAPMRINRTHALGDVLMLRSLIPAVKRKKDIDVKVYADAYDFLVTSLNTYKASTYSINLSGTVELDHSINTKWSKKHRIDIFAEALGVKFKKDDLDFSLDFISEKPLIDEKYIVIQGSGSSDVKTLKEDAYNTVLYELSVAFPEHKILVLNHKKPTIDINKTSVSGSKLPFPDFWNVIKNADFCVCLDSGPLWVTHFTKTPVIALLGSTPIKTRLTYHPLFGTDGCHGIELFNLVGCKQCNELGVFCNNKYTCLSPNKNQLKMALEPTLAKIGEYISISVKSQSPL